MNRSQPSYQTVPDVIGGYFLEDGRGWFSIIKPEDGQNDIANPSFERNTTGWTAQNSTIARAVTYQYRGIYSLKITPTNGNAAGVSYTVAGISSSIPNTMSVYLLGHPGDTYQLYAGSFGSRSASSQLCEVRGTGRWQRLVITCHAGGALVVARKSGGTTNPFYIDAAQSEAKSYVTTYIDGDEVGMLSYTQSYWWDGLSHASKSHRLANGNGGREMKLLDLGFRLMVVIGLGMLPIINAVLPLANGGGMYQRSVYQSRQFTLAGAITGTTLSEVQKQRAALIELCSPFNLGEQQPLLMKYHVLDEDKQEAAVGNIECGYESGLEGDIDNFHQDRVGLVFRQFVPLITSDQSASNTFVKPAYVAADDLIVKMNRYGEFSLLSPGDYTAAIRATVYGYSKSGYLFVGGSISPYLYQWDGSNYTLPGATSPNGEVLAIANDYYGGVWIGGKFTAITGVANTAHIAYTNGVAWSALSTGTNGDVNAIIQAQSGIYIAGAFTLAGGVADTKKIAIWNGTAFSPLGTGITGGDVLTMAIDAQGRIYAGGSFTSAGGIANTAYIAMWDGAWHSVGGVTNGSVTGLVIGADGNLYAGGNFTSIGGVACAGKFAMWNGASWIDLSAPIWVYPQSKLVALPTGEILMDMFHSSFYAANYAIYNKGQYHPGLVHSLTLNLDNSGPKWYNPATGDVYFGQAAILTEIPVPYSYISDMTKLIENTSPVIAYPKIYIRGPMDALTGIVNRTNGARIYFNFTTPLSIFPDETIIVSTGQANFSIRSDVRGDLSSYVLADSTAVFYLSPGENIIAIGDITKPTVTGASPYLATLELSGVTTENSDNGTLYATFTKPGAAAILKIYKDSAKTQQVAESSGAVTGADIETIVEKNASGITGVFDHTYVSDLNSVVIQCPLVFVTYQESYLSIDQMRP